MNEPRSLADPADQSSDAGDGIEALFVEWRESLNRRWRVERRLRYLGLLVVLLGVAYFVVEIGFGRRLPSVLFIVWPIMAFVSAFAWFYNRYLTAQTEGQINKIDDMRFVGLLIEMSSESGKLKMSAQIREASNKVLARLLPRMTRSHSALLNDYHRKALRKFASSSPVLTVPILKAWEQIGGRDEFLIVRKLAKGAIFSQDTPKIRQAAIGCLPSLQANVEADKQRDILLRAAAPAEDLRPTLLRPAEYTAREGQDQLLRPTE